MILLKSIFLDCIKNRSEISGCILGKNEMEPPFEHKETFGVVDELCLLKRDCFGDDPYQNTGRVISIATIYDILNDITLLRRDLVEII